MFRSSSFACLLFDMRSEDQNQGRVRLKDHRTSRRVALILTGAEHKLRRQANERSGIQKALEIKDLFVFEHMENGDGEFVRDLSASSSAAMFAFKPVDIFGDMFIGLCTDNNLSHSPFEIGIADFLITTLLGFIVGRSFAFDDTAVGREFLHGFETVEAAHLIENIQRDHGPNAGDGEENGIIARTMILGLASDLGFELGNDWIESINDIQIGGDVFSDIVFAKALDELPALGLALYYS